MGSIIWLILRLRGGGGPKIISFKDVRTGIIFSEEVIGERAEITVS